MNEERTAAILIELRRIGVDLGSLTERLVGTGLRSSELLGWLRLIPDGAGADALVRRLDERARHNMEQPVAVRWRAEPARPAHRYGRERWWPTQVLLDAGTDLLIEEWDPFGLRLAGTDREAIAMCAFHFFGPLLAPNDHPDPLGAVAAYIASAEQDQLALRPSPEPHRRYLATRLRELVDQYPVPKLRVPARSHVVMREVRSEDGPPPLDPEGVCARCHSFGTVARVTTLEPQPPRSTRYCAACWQEIRAHETLMPTKPETAAEHIAFLDHIERPPTATLSRSWVDTLQLLRLVTSPHHANRTSESDRLRGYAQLAHQIREAEDRMDGPMPPDVEEFVRRYGDPPA